MKIEPGRPALLRLAATALAALLLLTPAPAVAHCEGPALWHTIPTAELATKLPPEIASIGLWRPGQGAFVAPRLQVPWAAVGGEIGKPGDQRSVRDFAIYHSGGETFFALVFSPEERNEELVPALAGDGAFQSALASHQADWHLIDFEPYRVGNARRWAALFGEGQKSQELVLGIAAGALEKKVNQQHRHLANFTLHSAGRAEPAFAALFDSAKGEQKLYAALEAAELHPLMHALHPQNFRLERLIAYRDDHGRNRYAALFEKAGGDDHVWVQGCDRACGTHDGDAATVDHLAEREEVLRSEKASLRLVAIDLPMGEVRLADLGLTGAPAAHPPHAQQPIAAPTRSGGGQPSRSGRPDQLTQPIRPTCTHAGVFHDGGTNGPPDPP